MCIPYTGAEVTRYQWRRQGRSSMVAFHFFVYIEAMSTNMKDREQIGIFRT